MSESETTKQERIWVSPSRGVTGFEAGVLWAAAFLVEFHGEATLAKLLIQESDVDINDADDRDKPFLQRAME